MYMYLSVQAGLLQTLLTNCQMQRTRVFAQLLALAENANTMPRKHLPKLCWREVKSQSQHD